MVLFPDPTNPLCPPCWLLLITPHIQTSSLLLFLLHPFHLLSSCSHCQPLDLNRLGAKCVKDPFDSHLFGRYAYLPFDLCVYKNRFVPRVCIDSFCAFKAARSVYFLTCTRTRHPERFVSARPQQHSRQHPCRVFTFVRSGSFLYRWLGSSSSVFSLSDLLSD